MENITMEELSKKTLPELRDMAKALNIKSVTKYKKNDLIELIKDNSNDNKEDNTAKDSDEHVKKQNINSLIEQCYDKKNYNIKIINCYEVRDNEDLGKIISENGYTQILNTKGECNIKKTVL